MVTDPSATGRPAEDAHVDEALRIADLGEALERPVRTYSQGMRQRLAIAQAMLGLPDLLILDEPTNGLDPPQIREMRAVVTRYAAGGRTVIVSSHLLSEVEQSCTHLVVMDKGQLVAAGPVEEITGGGSGGTLLVGTGELAADRLLHDAEHGLVILDQRDVDRELAVALDELARAVERIDEPITRPALARRPGDAGRFLAQHRHVRRQRAEPLDDDVMRGEIGCGQRRAIVLVLDREIRLVDIEDRRRRAFGEVRELMREPGEIEAHGCGL